MHLHAFPLIYICNYKAETWLMRQWNLPRKMSIKQEMNSGRDKKLRRLWNLYMWFFVNI